MFSSSTTISDYSNIMNPLVMERATSKWKYNNVEIAPNCPRCASSNTKFCYYNNYSLSQPRYFCKGCRRYWTKGGSLRNVPVGGGCRKSRRSRAARQSGGPSYSDPALAGSAEASSGGTCIDMAAVFAKYVDQQQHVENVENEESFSPGASSGSSDNQQASTTFDVDSQLEDVTTFDMIGVGDDQMQQQAMMMPQLSTCHDFTGQQFVYQDSNGFGLGMQQQGVVLCDDDVMWAEGTTLPNLGYQQPMVQVEDCGLFAADDDQLRIPANLVSENWGSFDLSAYDFYSTP